MKKETKKAAKARLIAERLAEKERIKEERRAKCFSTPVAIAVEPLRVDAMQEARADALAKVKEIKEHGYHYIRENGQYVLALDITIEPKE